MSHTPRPSRLAFLIGSWLVISPASLLGDDTGGAGRLVNDCGVNSLYLLLRLNSVEADIAALRLALPDHGVKGLSMAEIQAASARFGVPLQGKRLGPASIPIDRPMIVFLKFRDELGHFVVLEPVGSRGKRVLVLDFPRPPRIVDYADLMGGEDWTGLAMAPITVRERWGPWLVGGVGVALVSLGLAFPWMLRNSTRRRDRDPHIVAEDPAATSG